MPLRPPPRGRLDTVENMILKKMSKGMDDANLLLFSLLSEQAKQIVASKEIKGKKMEINLCQKALSVVVFFRRTSAHFEFFELGNIRVELKEKTYMTTHTADYKNGKNFQFYIDHFMELFNIKGVNVSLIGVKELEAKQLLDAISHYEINAVTASDDGDFRRIWKLIPPRKYFKLDLKKDSIFLNLLFRELLREWIKPMNGLRMDPVKSKHKVIEGGEEKETLLKMLVKFGPVIQLESDTIDEQFALILLSYWLSNGLPSLDSFFIYCRCEEQNSWETMQRKIMERFKTNPTYRNQELPKSYSDFPYPLMPHGCNVELNDYPVLTLWWGKRDGMQRICFDFWDSN